MLKPKQTDSGDELWESFPFLNKATVKTDNKYVQIVLQHYSRTCKKWKPVLRVLPPTFKPVVQQIKAAASCVILTSDWIKSYGSHAILESYVACCKPSLSWASKTHNMYRFCFSKREKYSLLSTGFASMLQNKLHLFVTRFIVPEVS